jgi:hypothetical protein
VERGGGCMVSCLGLYADVSYIDSHVEDQALAQDSLKLVTIQEEYNNYKNQFAKNLLFHVESTNLSKNIF